MAISSWNDKKNGVYRWFEKERYTSEFCEIQIEYFLFIASNQNINLKIQGNENLGNT